MNEFDQFVKHELKIKHHVRYADDFVILSKNKAYLLSLIPRLSHFLSKKLHLHLHPDKISLNTLASGVDFLGWVHFPDHRVLRTSTKRRMLKRVSERNESSYLGMLSHGNAHTLQMTVHAFAQQRAGSAP